MGSEYFYLLDKGFFLAAFIFLVLFFLTVYNGKELFDKGHGMSTEHREDVKREHVWCAGFTLWSLIFAVLFIEIKVRLGGFADRATWLILTHLFFAIPFLCALLLLRFKITGTKNLALHKKIAYTSIVLFVGTIITGSLLFFNW